MDDINKKLSVSKILKDAYKNLLSHIKPFLILSYLVMFPLFIARYLFPITISQNQPLSLGLITFLLITLAFILLLSIFLFRLYMFGDKELFKITPIELGKIFQKTFLYTIALVMVILLAFLSVGLLMLLMLSIIGSVAGESAASGVIISTIISSVIFAFLILIILRTQPTFVSIAVNDPLLPMKSAYYYTRDNNWNLLSIGFLAYIPLLLISMGVMMLVDNTTIADSNIHIALSFIVAPINLLPFALQTSAGIGIYKYLVPGSTDVHNVDGNITV
ncbi:MAG: hypothetical protein HOH19_08815 [Kordiimonadaceae bacterium]|jgi:hypothetical protein|nr:hypothetical protein [Kordiimonadaceae bacterium]MBT6032664.1 hypothetical protein [Kordiimonadaceae bacterium]